jgi:hypothetical protein
MEFKQQMIECCEFTSKILRFGNLLLKKVCFKQEAKCQIIKYMYKMLFENRLNSELMI